MNNKLNITIEGGRQVVIDVFDIIDSYAFNKTFIIYALEENHNTIYASILNEKETSYSLDTITNPEEIAYINAEIDRVADELQNDEVSM